MTSSAIAVSNLYFSYEKTPILHQVNLQIAPGEFIGIMGPNGGGKTTLLKLLMGFLKPKQGQIKLFGLSPNEMRLKIGYVPQVHHTDRDFPITVFDLILLGAVSKSLFYSQEIKLKAEQLMEELGLIPYKNKPFSSLSGGLAQKALLARALLSDPDILFLDEFLANVDTHSSQMILAKLEESKKKKTILMVTHDLRTIVERVDRILCVQGQVSSLVPEEICEHFALGLYHAPLLSRGALSCL
jgi:zinc transport system ATP-binding protein